MSACGHDALMIAALADGELDAAHAAQAEALVRECADCAAEHARLMAVRAALRGGEVKAPARLRARLGAIADSPPAKPVRAARPWAWAAGGAGAALAACAALFVAVGQFGPDLALENELVAAHVRSLQASHLTDIGFSDQHVVKPWFDGRLDYAPPVIDLAAQGFPMVGGRLDYVDGRPTAAIVYRRGRHLINLFVWPAGRRMDVGAASLSGYGLRHWSAGGMTWWAVSDVNPGDLNAFETLLKARSG